MEQTRIKQSHEWSAPFKWEGENIIWTCMKICSLCHIEQPISEYHYKRGTTQNRCKACRSKYQKAHYLKNREREREIRRSWYKQNKSYVSEKMKKDYAENPEKYAFARRLQKYNLSKERYMEILKSQSNKCVLCERSFLNEVKPHIDHCHETRIVRGILCAQCNTGFGLFKEDEAIFERAIAYSRKYKK